MLHSIHFSKAISLIKSEFGETTKGSEVLQGNIPALLDPSSVGALMKCANERTPSAGGATVSMKNFFRAGVVCGWSLGLEVLTPSDSGSIRN